MTSFALAPVSENQCAPVVAGGSMQSRRSVGFGLVLTLAFAATAQDKPPTEAQCRQMTEFMLREMNPAQHEAGKEKDRERAREVFERADRIVRDNRKRGASECESWAAISKLITRQ